MDQPAVEAALSDEELALRVAAGDPAAETALVRRLGPRVRLYGLRHLREPAAADDLVQEVLLLTLERLRAGRVRQPERLASFVFGACRLVVRNLRRGSRRRDGLLERFASEFPRRAEVDPLLLDRGRLRDCLAQLAERERSVLVLSFYAEEPSAGIAARLGPQPGKREDGPPPSRRAAAALRGRRRRMKPCSSPLSDAWILAWWSGELSAPEGRRLERHLLSCGSCSARAQLAGALAEGIRGLVREGRLPVVVDPIVLERLRGEGRRIREYRVAPGGSVQCTVAPEDDVVLSRLVVDLEGVTRLDLVRRSGERPEQRFADLPFDAGSGELVFAPAIDQLRALPALVERMRLVAVEPSGERLLGEYTFDHSPWPGGRP